MRTCHDALNDATAAIDRGGRRMLALLLITAGLLGVASYTARADDDLPGRVGRIAEFAGQLYLSPEDNATEWQQVGLNYPVASGDNLWVGGDGRAEVDYGGGQFRLGGDTSLHVSRLDENQVALFVAQGRVIVRVRVLDAGDSAHIDAPNTQIQLTRPGLYRIDVSPDRQSTSVTVREGEAVVMLASGAQQALPGQSVTVTGPDPLAADVRNGVIQDGFDSWSASRDRRYERPRTTSYVSRQMVGYADLDEYGSWQSTPEYGAVWYPTTVGADWAPYRDGYWTNVGSWGLTWVDSAPWGYAPFHYGRWAWVGGRWGWCPGAFVARPLWAPALVGWVGGAGWGVSARFGSPVYGWVPLGWGEPFHPWWNRCSYNCWAKFNRPYAVNVAVRPNTPPAQFRNVAYPGAVTAVPAATIAARLPVASNRVNVPTHQMSTAPVLAAAPPVAAGPLRIPATRAGTAGTPPPASTFFPVSRPGRLAADPAGRPTATGTGTVVRAAPPAPAAGRPTAVAPAPARVPGAAPAYARPAPVVTPAPAAVAPPPTQNAPGAAASPPRADMVGRPRAQPPQSAGIPMPSPSSSQAPPAPTYAAPVARPVPARPPAGERIAPMPPSHPVQVAPVPSAGAPVMAPGPAPYGGAQAAPVVVPNREGGHADKSPQARPPAAKGDPDRERR